MALPLAPIAIAAVKYGSVAVAAYSVARNIKIGRTNEPGEQMLDETPEGISIHRPRDRDGQLNASAKWLRTIRLGRTGPGYHIDFSALARLRIRKAQS